MSKREKIISGVIIGVVYLWGLLDSNYLFEWEIPLLLALGVIGLIVVVRIGENTPKSPPKV